MSDWQPKHQWTVQLTERVWRWSKPQVIANPQVRNPFEVLMNSVFIEPTTKLQSIDKLQTEIDTNLREQCLRTPTPTVVQWTGLPWGPQALYIVYDTITCDKQNKWWDGVLGHAAAKQMDAASNHHDVQPGKSSQMTPAGYIGYLCHTTGCRLHL